MTASETYYHGTKADLKAGDLIAPRYASNYDKRKQANRHSPERLKEMHDHLEDLKRRGIEAIEE